MSLQDVKVAPGNWVVANCGDFPSEKNCKLVMMAPEGQRQDLIEAAAAHAAKDHGHQDTPEFRAELDKFVRAVTV